MNNSNEYPQPMVDLYDSFYPGQLLYGDDRILYRELADRLGSPVLELAVGTGRVARYLAEHGIPVVGLEISSLMLERARANITKLSESAQQNIALVQGDMRDFELERQFPLIIIPFSAFQHMLTVEEQIRVLRCVRQHLGEGGHLVIDNFDPKLEVCVPRGAWARTAREALHPETGRCWKIVVDSRENLTEQQIFHEEWRLVELAPDGRIVNQFYWRLTLRWSYRFEMQHLLERCGFTVVNLWGDYQKGAFKYGQRQVWFVRKA